MQQRLVDSRRASTQVCEILWLQVPGKQAQTHLVVVSLAPCLSKHMPTVKVDGVRLELGKTGGLPPIPLAWCQGFV